MERKKNEALGRPMLTKVEMSVFVRTLVYAVRTAAQSVAGELHGPEQMQVQVLVQVPKPPLLLDMVLPVELVPVAEQVPVSMPDPPVDQTDPLTLLVPNPQLDQTELLLSVLEQLPMLDPLLKVVLMCETAVIVSGLQ